MRNLDSNDLALLDKITGGWSAQTEIATASWGMTRNPAFARGFFQNTKVHHVGWTNGGNNFNTVVQTAVGAVTGSAGGIPGAALGAIGGGVTSGTFYA